MSEGLALTTTPAARNRLVETLLSAPQQPVAKYDRNHGKTELSALGPGESTNKVAIAGIRATKSSPGLAEGCTSKSPSPAGRRRPWFRLG